MKRQQKSLLSKETVDREALTHSFLNIKPRFYKGLRRLKYINYKLLVSGIACITFLGYYPTFTLRLPPIQHSTVHAQEEQKHEIVSAAFPEPVSLPHPGYLSTKFSSYHPGIDIATGLGMPIHPITAGVVEEVNFGLFGYGNHIIISHNGGFKSMYAHLGKIYVKKGQPVSPDNIIGEVGMTGHTSGPHTHLEISYNSKNIDPLTILPALSDYPKPEYLTPIANTEQPIKKRAETDSTALRKTLTPDFQ